MASKILDHQDDKPPKVCACKIVSPIFNMYRFTGMLPFSYTHNGDLCVFRISYKWLTYSVCLMLAITLQLILSLNISKFTHITHITTFLNDVTDTMSSVLVMIFGLFSLWKSSSMIKYLNRLARVVRELEVCNSAANRVMKVQYATMALAASICVAQYIVLLYMNIAPSLEISLDYNILINKVVQNLIPAFCVFLLCIFNVTITTFACFEKLTLKGLRYD